MTYKLSTTSPLRYPGGKSRIVECIANFLPPGTTSVCSPFFGGGSVELYLAKKGMRVYGYDVFEPLTDFWQELLRDSGQLAESVQTYYPMSKALFSQLKSEFETTACKAKRGSHSKS